MVEVVTPSAHSSSYPPHKHDSDNVPLESSLEETYYHRLNPEQGFAFQRVYTDDRSIDEAMAVENHDVVMVPRGYHPVATIQEVALRLREDIASEPNAREANQKNAPAVERGLFLVPKVIE